MTAMVALHGDALLTKMGSHGMKRRKKITTKLPIREFRNTKRIRSGVD
jgi:hypothetical protein